jgi:cation:H+ antiporter
MTFLTLFLIVAIYVSRKRSKSSPGHAYLGRILGTILVSFYALYYYLLYITL